MTYDEWRAKHPVAAAELVECFTDVVDPPGAQDKSEAWAQQRARFRIAQGGAMAWRNNVGALKDERGVPVRYGLANESKAVNDKLKSSDLILAIPRRITRQDVGTTLAQFGSVECKPPGWRYTGTPRERAQLAWLTLIRRLGGFATFSTGEVDL